MNLRIKIKLSIFSPNELYCQIYGFLKGINKFMSPRWGWTDSEFFTIDNLSYTIIA